MRARPARSTRASTFDRAADVTRRSLPLLVVPPLAVVVLVAGYPVYGLPFVVVTSDAGLREALAATVAHATRNGRYAAFGVGHLAVGTVASLALPSLVRIGLPGVLFGTAAVPVPAVSVASHGLLSFRGLDRERTADGPPGGSRTPQISSVERAGRPAGSSVQPFETAGGLRCSLGPGAPTDPYRHPREEARRKQIDVNATALGLVTSRFGF